MKDECASKMQPARDKRKRNVCMVENSLIMGALVDC